MIKSNILTSMPGEPNVSAAIGEARSQGIELDLTGQLNDQFSIIGSYAYTDTRITKNNDGGGEGSRLPNVPEHAGSLWLNTT